MIKPFLPYIYTGAIIIGTVTVGYLLAEKNGLLETSPPAKVTSLESGVNEPVTLIAPEPELEEENTTLIDPDATTKTEIPIETEANEEVEAPAAKVPVFSTLRVERDGSAVIAGMGPQNSEIEILDGDTVIATTTAAPNGDFAVVLDAPLKPGSHSLFIRAIPPEKEAVFSAEAGLINIPQPGTQEEVTVLVSQADQPTRILQKPELETRIVSATASESVEVIQSEETAVSVENNQTEEVVEPEVVPQSEEVQQSDREEETETASLTEDEEEPSQTQNPEAVVLIEAADVEKNRIFIAGKGSSGNEVQLYLNTKFLGKTVVSENNAFLFEGSEALEAGRYDLRADMIDPQTGKVIARAEVNLLHEPKEEEAPVAIAETQSQQENEVIADSDTESATAASEVEVEIAEQQELIAVETETTEVQSSEALEQKQEIKTGSSVIIRRGDNLWAVATRNYGVGIRYTTIFEANRDQVRDPDLIFPGQVLKVPENNEVDEEQDAG